MKMAEQLRRAITESDLTHYRLARLAGVAVSVIDRFIGGKRDVRLSTASRIADALGMEFESQKKEKKSVKAH